MMLPSSPVYEGFLQIDIRRNSWERGGFIWIDPRPMPFLMALLLDLPLTRYFPLLLGDRYLRISTTRRLIRVNMSSWPLL